MNSDAFVPGGDRSTDARVAWGRTSDKMLLADVDGDGREDLVLRRGTTFLVDSDAFVAGGDPGRRRR